MENATYLQSVEYPKCPRCLCNLIFDISDDKIQVYCSECLCYYELNVNEQIVENAFSNLKDIKFSINKLSEKIKCEKCKNIYCSFCYRYHKDYVSSFAPKKKVKEMEEIKIIEMEKQIKYKNYNIKCDKCKRQYLSGVPSPKNYENQKLSAIKENFQNAQNHLTYYLNLKNEITTEILHKINTIENSFQKNYNYHKNFFELINTLLLLVKKTSDSSAIYKSLNNLSDFIFPKVDISNLDNLDYKIDVVTNFFNQRYINRKTEYEPIKIFDNYQETPNKIDSVFRELPNKNLLFKQDYGFRIYNHFNFNCEAEFDFPETLEIDDVIPLKNNLFLIQGDENAILLCCCDKNGCSLKYFRDSKGVQIRGSYISYLAQNNIIIILEEPTYNMVFIDGNYPYKRLHEIKFYSNDSILTIYELSDGRILIILSHHEKNQRSSSYWFIFYRPKDFGLNKTVKFYNPQSLNSTSKFIEISNNKTILFSTNTLFIINYNTGQTESKIVVAKKKQSIQEVKPVTQIKDAVVVALNFSLKIYNMTNYQQIFEINPGKNVANFILLSNRTLLVLYNSDNDHLLVEEDAIDDHIFYGIKAEKELQQKNNYD